MSDPIGYNGSYVDMAPFEPPCIICGSPGRTRDHSYCALCEEFIPGPPARHFMDTHFQEPGTKLDYQPRMAQLAAQGKLPEKQARDLDYQTPEYVLEPIRRVLGGVISLDPASCRSNPTKALAFFTPEEDGLKQAWDHPWFVNPPYGKEMRAWIEKIGQQTDPFLCTGLALLPVNRTETQYWQDCIAGKANMVCWVRKRVAFIRPSTGLKAQGNPYASAIWGFHVSERQFSEHLSVLGRCCRV